MGTALAEGVQGVPKHGAPLEPGIALHAPTGGYGPNAVIGVIELYDGFDVVHGLG
jgi:hypothetical protein